MSDLVIEITINANSVTCKPDGPSETVIDGRLVDSVAGKYKNEFRGRGKTRHNHATTHVPIVLDVKNSSSDTVTWTCAEPFYLEVETDPDYNDLANAPPHPFTKASWGDSLLREAVKNNGKYEVKGIAKRMPSVGNQKFYKYTIWAKNSLLKHDPDIICER